MANQAPPIEKVPVQPKHDGMNMSYDEGRFQIASHYAPNAISKLNLPLFIMMAFTLTACFYSVYMLLLLGAEIAIFLIIYVYAVIKRPELLMDSETLLKQAMLKIGDNDKGIIKNVQEADLYTQPVVIGSKEQHTLVKSVKDMSIQTFINSEKKGQHE